MCEPRADDAAAGEWERVIEGPSPVIHKGGGYGAVAWRIAAGSAAQTASIAALHTIVEAKDTIIKGGRQ